MANRKKVVKNDSTLDFEGVWYNPENPGYGIFIKNFGEETQALTIYSFDTDGNQVWLTGVGSRGTGTLELLEPKGRGFLDNLAGASNGEAVGRIELDVVEGGKISYVCTIKRKSTGVDFSPPPPPFTVYTGTLSRLG